MARCISKMLKNITARRFYAPKPISTTKCLNHYHPLATTPPSTLTRSRVSTSLKLSKNPTNQDTDNFSVSSTCGISPLCVVVRSISVRITDATNTSLIEQRYRATIFVRGTLNDQSSCTHLRYNASTDGCWILLVGSQDNARYMEEALRELWAVSARLVNERIVGKGFVPVVLQVTPPSDR